MISSIFFSILGFIFTMTILILTHDVFNVAILKNKLVVIGLSLIWPTTLISLFIIVVLWEIKVVIVPFLRSKKNILIKN